MRRGGKRERVKTVSWGLEGWGQHWLSIEMCGWGLGFKPWGRWVEGLRRDGGQIRQSAVCPACRTRARRHSPSPFHPLPHLPRPWLIGNDGISSVFAKHTQHPGWGGMAGRVTGLLKLHNTKTLTVTTCRKYTASVSDQSWNFSFDMIFSKDTWCDWSMELTGVIHNSNWSEKLPDTNIFVTIKLKINPDNLGVIYSK